jgi:hypothetical protein
LPLVALPQSVSVLQSPHLPTGAQMSVRHWPLLVHDAPGGSPHLLSVGSQMPERHSLLFGGGPHEAPFGKPQMLSVVSQTPDTQTRWPLETEHWPLIGKSLGSG